MSMNMTEYFDLMKLLKKLSKHGWTYVYGFDNGHTVRKLIHGSHGSYEFHTWLDLEKFAKKQYRLINS